MRLLFYSFFLILIILICPQQGQSQTCCTGGPPLTGSLNVQALPPSGWGISFTLDNNYIDDIIQGADILPNDNLVRKTRTLVAQIDYGVAKNITATIMLPYVWLSQEVIFSGIIERSSGLGDVLLLGQYGKSVGDRNSLVFGAGLKFPTGGTQHRDETLLTPLPPSMQPGTGSLDIFLIGQYQYSFNSRPSMTLTQTMNARINSESKNFTFHEYYRFGHVIQSFSTLADQLVIGTSIHSPSLTLRYRFSTKDLQEGNQNQNTGGHWIYFSPGWSTNISKNIVLGLVGEIPLYRHLNGLQLTTNKKLIITLQFLIPSDNATADL